MHLINNASMHTRFKHLNFIFTKFKNTDDQQNNMIFFTAYIGSLKKLFSLTLHILTCFVLGTETVYSRRKRNALTA